MVRTILFWLLMVSLLVVLWQAGPPAILMKR